MSHATKWAIAMAAAAAMCSTPVHANADALLRQLRDMDGTKWRCDSGVGVVMASFKQGWGGDYTMTLDGYFRIDGSNYDWGMTGTGTGYAVGDSGIMLAFLNPDYSGRPDPLPSGYNYDDYSQIAFVQRLYQSNLVMAFTTTDGREYSVDCSQWG